MALKRWVAAGDLHGDQGDPATMNALARFCSSFKPHHRICLGDTWDIRPWRGKASEEEKREGLRSDFDAGMAWLESFRPTTILLGNHDQRLWDKVEFGHGAEKELAESLVERAENLATQLRAAILPYTVRDGIFRIGHLKFLHGFYCGAGAARKHALAFGCCIFGHCHAIDEASIEGSDRRTARGTGALCNISMPYNRRSVGSLRHANGWSYGVVDEKTGNFSAFQAEIINGKAFVAEGIRAI